MTYQIWAWFETIEGNVNRTNTVNFDAHWTSGAKKRAHERLRKAEEANFKANVSFFTSLSAAEAHVFGVKFIGLYGTVVFIAIRDFSC